MKAKKILLLIIIFLMLGLISGCHDDGGPVDGGGTDIGGDKPIRPHTHDYTEETVLKAATLFEKGQKTLKCSLCDDAITNDYYYLDEIVFSNMTYQYDGAEHSIEIKGLIPKGLKVEYLNNKRTSIGTTIAKANLIDADLKIVKTLEAALIITSYVGLPLIEINTGGNLIDSKEIYTASTVTLTNCDSLLAFANKDAGVRLRGNGTLGAAKKPYRIKFATKQNILGLNDGLNAKSWVLLAEYYDYSFFRNATAFMMGDALFNQQDNYFSSDFAFVNLSINGVYNGVYLLAEQSQVNKGRVNINEPKENDTSLEVGYFVEIDQYAEVEGDSFVVGLQKFGLKTDYYSLKSDYYLLARKDYISKYLNSVMEILYSAAVLKKYYELDENFNLVKSNATSAYEAINKVIDVDSFLRSYILEEIIKDIDVGYSSYYLYVDFSADSKINRLTTSVPWDFDWSSGNAKDVYSPRGEYNSNVFDHMNLWLFLLSKCDFFKEMISEYYTVFRNSKVMEQIYAYQDYLTSAFESEFTTNFRKWNVLGTSVHTYHPDDIYTSNTHPNAVKKLQTWLKERITFLDSLYYLKN